MATGKYVFDEGTGLNAATYTVSEDAVTKHIARSVLNNSSGTEIGTASTPVQVSLANTGANSTAVKVDGSAVTQPVSGTVTANLGTIGGAATAANQSTANTSLATLAGAVYAEDTGSANLDPGVMILARRTATPANTSGSDLDYESLQMAGGRLWVDASGKTLTVDGSGVTQPVSIAGSVVVLPMGGGAAIQGGTGAVSSTSPRVSLATDIPLPAGTNVIGALSANQSVNVAQINGVTPLMGNGVTGTGSQRVTIASDNTAFAVNATLQANSGVDIGKLTANQSVNLAQLAGNTISSGVGTSGTGTLRTVVANDVGRTLVSTGGSAASSGNNTLVAAGTNKLKVYAFSLSTTSTTAVTCIFQSGASGTELWRVVLQAATDGTHTASTGANLVVTPPAYLFATASATLLNLNLSGAQTVHWSVSYMDEA